MASKKSASTEKDLKKSVKKLRAQLVRAEAKADKWKKRATKLEKSATRSDARAEKLSKKLDKASSPVVAPIPAITAPTESAETTDGTVSGPNEGWTVVQLRAEARSRGLTGLSGKSKSQLLEALS